MADRRTIYVPQSLSDALDRAVALSEGESFGPRLVAMALRYDALWRASLPTLTPAQWKAVADANNGVNELLMGERPEAVGTLLWANVADTPDLGQKWDIDQAKLVRQMRTWGVPQQIAAYEACRLFWVHHDKDTDKAMKLAGMIE